MEEETVEGKKSINDVWTTLFFLLKVQFDCEAWKLENEMIGLKKQNYSMEIYQNSKRKA